MKFCRDVLIIVCVRVFVHLFVSLCYVVNQTDKSAALLFCDFCTDCMKFQNRVFAKEKGTIT